MAWELVICVRDVKHFAVGGGLQPLQLRSYPTIVYVRVKAIIVLVSLW